MSTQLQKTAARLATIPALSAGKHRSPDDGMCLLEAASCFTDGPFTDQPASICPALGGIGRLWSDALPDDKRDGLLRQFITLLPGTLGSEAVSKRRALMAVDWLVRVSTSTWVRHAGLTVEANTLKTMPPIVDAAQIFSASSAMELVRNMLQVISFSATDQADKRIAVGAVATAAWFAAASAGNFAFRSGARHVLNESIGSINDVALQAMQAAAWGPAWEAAKRARVGHKWCAARTAADSALSATCCNLQHSAVALMHRMIEVQA